MHGDEVVQDADDPAGLKRDTAIIECRRHQRRSSNRWFVRGTGPRTALEHRCLG